MQIFECVITHSSFQEDSTVRLARDKNIDVYFTSLQEEAEVWIQKYIENDSKISINVEFQKNSNYATSIHICIQVASLTEKLNFKVLIAENANGFGLYGEIQKLLENQRVLKIGDEKVTSFRPDQISIYSEKSNTLW